MQYGVSLHSIGGFLSTRSTALIGRGWPTIPILPVCSMTTSANEPPRSPCVCQKGTVIEQSEVPILHSVIHSSDLNVSSPAAGAGTTNWAERQRNGSNTLRKCPICISGRSPTQPTSDQVRITVLAQLDKSRASTLRGRRDALALDAPPPDRTGTAETSRCSLRPAEGRDLAKRAIHLISESTDCNGY